LAAISKNRAAGVKILIAKEGDLPAKTVEIGCGGMV
jgi:hypothetical protein